MRPKKYRKKTGEANQQWLAATVDDKAAIFSFAEKMMPVIRRAHEKGLTAEQVLESIESLAALRVATELASEGATGLAAAKDILDRRMGKAKETKEIAHRLGKLPEQELDALLVSKLAALEESSGENE